MQKYTANVYRGLQGLYGEIGVWGFHIYFIGKSLSYYYLLAYVKLPNIGGICHNKVIDNASHCSALKQHNSF